MVPFAISLARVSNLDSSGSTVTVGQKKVANSDRLTRLFGDMETTYLQVTHPDLTFGVLFRTFLEAAICSSNIVSRTATSGEQQRDLVLVEYTTCWRPGPLNFV